MHQFRQRGEELAGDRCGGVTFRLESITRHKLKFSLYADGEQKAQCRVWLAGDDREIRISFGRGWESDSSYNEALTAKSDGVQAFLAPIGMALMAVAGEKLTATQAAEYLWDHLVR